jgi:hypothetical protein
MIVQNTTYISIYSLQQNSKATYTSSIFVVRVTTKYSVMIVQILHIYANIGNENKKTTPYILNSN